MSDTCTIFDGLSHVNCENEANEWGLCDEHTDERFYTDSGDSSEDIENGE